MAKQVLGRGLSALFGGNPPSAPSTPESAPAGSAAPAAQQNVEAREKVQMVPLNRIHPCPLQPRKEFPEESLKELAASIKEQGIIQPLVVRQRGDGFQLIAGERRWRAAQLLNLQTVPVIVRQVDDRTALEMMLIENLQRENLNPIEEALGFNELISQFQLTQEAAAAKVGKSRAAVANAIRLLKLPEQVQAWIRQGLLSAGHAKVILGLLNPEEQTLAAEKTLRDGLSVRQLEEMVALWQNRPPTPQTAGPKASPPTRDVHITDLESRLRERFGTKVTLRYRRGKGKVEIRFTSDDELQRILEITGIKLD
jgi:ParB family chromosome partitioning protein